MASLVIDDPLQIGECFFESNIRLSQGRRIRTDLPADMQEGKDRDFGG